MDNSEDIQHLHLQSPSSQTCDCFNSGKGIWWEEFYVSTNKCQWKIYGMTCSDTGDTKELACLIKCTCYKYYWKT